MKIKICGMRDAENIRKAGELAIDFMGFIFYPPSPRFAGNGLLSAEALKNLPSAIRKTGVFVSENINTLFIYVEKYALDVVQLHGNETPEYCCSIKEKYPSVNIIKSFSVSEPADFNHTKKYEPICDYFLFDTKTSLHGGSGQQFDWKIIENYRGKTPFFLSGGISANDAGKIKELQHPSFYGIDLNSRFEITAGIKNSNLLQTFIKTLKT